MANGDTQPGPMQSHESFSEFVSTHQGLMIGGGIVLVLLLAGFFMNSKTKTQPATATTGGDLSGLTNGTVYVPTQTNFSTSNIKYGPQVNSNDPNLTSVSGTQTAASNNPTTTTTTTTNNPPPVHSGPGDPTGQPPPTRTPPPPVPPPPTHNKGLIWDQRYSIRGGDTLSSIAATLTRTLRAQGMPGSMSLTWNDLYGHNTALINQYAQAHGFKTDYYNWIFPGESITVPRWG